MEEAKEVMYRCQNCDYLGTEVVVIDDEDCCPECQEDYLNIYEPMSEEQHEELEEFFNKGLWVGTGNKDFKNEFIDSDEAWAVMEELKNLGVEYYVYTVVNCEDDEDWILTGTHLCNRMSYFISLKKIHETEDDCWRYA